VSHLRSRKSDTQLYDTMVDDGLPRNPEAVAERQADEERVRQAVLRLGDEQRQVIILRFVEELDYREVAEILGKSVAAVRVIQHRALCALRKMMKVEEVA
jgi:RNA polymerase sigma-70 factor (ECF subfamily)